MRIGVFGGTFDPVHYGHLLLAESCREQCRLDQVWFLPAAIAPHKQHCQPASAEDRIAMLGLAIGGHEAFSVCTWETDRGGVNYSVDTLAAFRGERPTDEWFFLMGADSLADLSGWHQPERFCELALPVVVRRPGYPPPSFEGLARLVSGQRLAEIQRHTVETPLLDFSSSNLRARIARGQSIRYRTPRAVEKYIEAHQLYRDG